MLTKRVPKDVHAHEVGVDTPMDGLLYMYKFRAPPTADMGHLITLVTRIYHHLLIQLPHPSRTTRSSRVDNRIVNVVKIKVLKAQTTALQDMSYEGRSSLKAYENWGEMRQRLLRNSGISYPRESDFER